MHFIYNIYFLVKLPEVNQPENQQLRINNSVFEFIYASVSMCTEPQMCSKQFIN